MIISGIPANASLAVINDYKAVFINGCDAQGQLRIAIRSYTQDNSSYYLAVDPYALTTQRLPANNLKPCPETTKFQDTPYARALQNFSRGPYKLANYGLTHAQTAVSGMFLTIDMCPAKKPFEKDFFKTLVSLADKTQQATPIALSMSGAWMTRHPEELQWLIAQQQAGKLQITWMNHSLTHFYDPKLALQENFLLHPGTNMTDEILGEEKILLEYQQTPSIFFRFPGLIADKEVILKLNKLGLIPVGSNAWLAKGEKPSDGSIVLVHGNSNEPQGIKDIMPLLENTSLHWLPLPEAIRR